MDFKLTFEQAFPMGAILAGSRPWYEYKDNTRTDRQLGTTYILVRRPDYEQVSIKVPDLIPIMSNDEIKNSDSIIFVKAEGFSGSVYSQENSIKINGKAERLVIINA